MASGGVGCNHLQHVRAGEDGPHGQVVRLAPQLAAAAPVARRAVREAAEGRLAGLGQAQHAVGVRRHALDGVEARRERRDLTRGGTGGAILASGAGGDVDRRRL